MLAGRKAVRFNNKSFLGDQGKRKKLSFCLLKLKKLEKKSYKKCFSLGNLLAGPLIGLGGHQVHGGGVGLRAGVLLVARVSTLALVRDNSLVLGA